MWNSLNFLVTLVDWLPSIKQIAQRSVVETCTVVCYYYQCLWWVYSLNCVAIAPLTTVLWKRSTFPYTVSRCHRPGFSRPIQSIVYGFLPNHRWPAHEKMELTSFRLSCTHLKWSPKKHHWEKCGPPTARLWLGFKKPCLPILHDHCWCFLEFYVSTSCSCWFPLHSLV